MTQGIYKIEKNKKIAKNVYEMVLKGDTCALNAPGQFIDIKIDGLFLRRPISVCNFDESSIKIIYKTVGTGTELLSKMQIGDELDILVGLGNGFDTSIEYNNIVLIGGGVGIPPLYRLCKELLAAGKKVSVILGFNTKDEVFYENEFRALGAEVTVTTVDGSYGVKGFVTDVLKTTDYEYFYTCGPEPMFIAIEKIAKTSGQFSFEERMGCGFGACMGCSCETKYGYKRICKDGPVLKREEIVW
ncbi:MAG: dihydroorotate dehydrogenase electron transfer subunit [Acutalibacteraceae bacterium]|jgi:dihydroorotate dehydrogenase electron transfer subunit